MDKEAQRIAIAEACGWLRNTRPITDDLGPIGDLTEICWHHPNIHTTPHWKYSWPKEPPDYLNSLDAIRDAEKIIKAGPNWQKYLNELWNVVNPGWPDPKPVNIVNYLSWNFVHASAEQRAEAFLKTLGKWTD